ncbi:hypothetical protein ES705_25462 [subsurface metagenome]
MSKCGDKEFLLDMREAIERINVYIEEMKYEDFLQEMKTQDAVVRNFEIIGEAVKNLSKELKKRYKNVEWIEIAGMRDKIIHFYFGIKWSIVWSAIKDKLPSLKANVDTILKEIE